MEKEELIELLKTSREKEGQLRLKQNEKRKKEIALRRLEEEEYRVAMSPQYTEGSKSTLVSSKVENAVLNKGTKILELKEEISKIDDEIELLTIEVEEVKVRLGCLTYLEKEILTDRFVNEMTLDDIGNETFWRIRKQTRSGKTIRKIIENALQKMIKI